jgi:probable phosphoglycerate mutase
METRKIILLRHGESTSNQHHRLTGVSNPELTLKGREQAKRAAKFIKQKYNPIDLLYTSPLKRAAATAEAVGKRIKTPVQISDLLIETDFGDWEGMNREQLQSKQEWETYSQDPFHFHFPGGESPQVVKERVLQFKRDLTLNQSWNKALLVTHYTPIAFFLLEILGNDSLARFRIDNTSVSVIETTKDYEYISLLNFIP